MPDNEALARLKALSAQAAAIEQATRDALSGVGERTPAAVEAPDEDELRFALFRKQLDREFAVKLATALAERDLRVDDPFRQAAAARLAALEEATASANDLRLSLEISEEKRISLQEQLDQLTVICDERGTALEGLHAEYNTIEAELRVIAERHAAERLALVARADRLSRTCDERLATIQGVETISKGLSGQLEALSSEYASVRAALKNLEATAQARLETIEAGAKEREGLSKEREGLSRQLEALSAEYATVSEALHALEKTAHSRLLAIESGAKEREALAATAQSRLEALESGAKEREALAATAQSRLDTIEIGAKERAALADEREGLSKQLEALNAEYTAVRTAVGDLERAAQSRLEALEASALDGNHLRDNLERSEEERSSLVIQVAELTRVCDERLAALEQLNAEYVAVATEAANRATVIEAMRVQAKPQTARA